MYPFRITSVSNREELVRFLMIKLPGARYDEPFVKCRIGINQISKVLAEYIWDYVLIRKIKYYLIKSKIFEKDDRYVVFERIIDVASCIRVHPDIVEHSLSEYLKLHRTISVDGFANFRLRELINRIKALSDICISEYLAQKEYEEYIELLKNFVKQQKSEYKEVHIITGEDGQHRIYNDEGMDITFKCLEGFVDSKMAINASLDDLMVTTLIAVAPNRIIIHNENKSGNPELVETIKGVFAGRIIISNN
ncbi:MAG TPA: hypothetical protein GXZ66_01125 [Clostridiaceae bacterium]|jgi:putative sporulation protein YtxC|nr:hypothetical protein [Clostridiaceae bacterium]